jgi:hypothetical protein
MKKCVDHIIKFDCEDTTMCSVNCATEGKVDLENVKIMPFNNYGKYFLRIRICDRVVHEQRIHSYSLVDVVSCKELEDFVSCNRFIPPGTYVPVVIPADTIYMEVDSCVKDPYKGTYECGVVPKVMLFGNKYNFPRTYDVPKSADSQCNSDLDCLGSYCDFKFQPPACSPKTMRHVRFYLFLYINL